MQPADLPATEIDVRLGASWLPPSDVQHFVHGLLGVPSGVEVGHKGMIFFSYSSRLGSLTFACLAYALWTAMDLCPRASCAKRSG